MQHTFQDIAINAIRKTIELKRLNQSDVSDTMELSRQSISKYLTGRTEMTLNVLEKFCNALEIPVAEIFLQKNDNSIPTWIINEEESVYSTNQSYKRVVWDIKKQNKQLRSKLKTFEKIEKILERQYQDKCREVDRLEKMLSMLSDNKTNEI